MDKILLSHGNGGSENAKLIKDIFYANFSNSILQKSEDSAIIENNLAFSTDSYTVSPIFFNGGDIGKLSICGTCNDLAMMGAKPLYLSCGFIIEEGFSIKDLEKITLSMKEELAINGAKIVAGDTKVVPKGSVDKIFINTSGVGKVQKKGLSSSNLKENDVIIFSNSIGEHGASIFAKREGIDLETNLKSDCASLWSAIEALIGANVNFNALRDATRGGVASLLNEWAMNSNVSIEIDEESVLIKDEVRGICELLGFEAYNLANEGTFAIALCKDEVNKALSILEKFEITKQAKVVGKVNSEYPKKVVLKTPWGSKRFLDMPSGELLPRIC